VSAKLGGCNVHACKKKHPVFYYTILLSVSYCNCTDFTRMYLVLFEVLSFENCVKEFNNPGKVFFGI